MSELHPGLSVSMQKAQWVKFCVLGKETSFPDLLDKLQGPCSFPHQHCLWFFSLNTHCPYNGIFNACVLPLVKLGKLSNALKHGGRWSWQVDRRIKFSSEGWGPGSQETESRTSEGQSSGRHHEQVCNTIVLRPCRQKSGAEATF